MEEQFNSKIFTEKEQFVCKYCGSEWKSKGSLKSHEIKCKCNPNRVIGKRNDGYTCEFCGEHFTDKAVFERHLRTCIKNPENFPDHTYKCKYECGREFKDKRSLGVHEAYCIKNPERVVNVSKNKGKKFVIRKDKRCLYCGNKFHPYYKKQDGSEYYSPRRKFCCQSCATKYYQEHPRRKVAKKYTHICNVCGKITENRKQYSNHPQDYICFECRKAIATEKRGYSTCPICGQINCNDERCKEPEMLKKLRATKKIFKDDFDDTKIGTPQIHEEVARLKAKLEDMYYIQKMSVVDISNFYNVNFHQIRYQFLNLFHIQLRTPAEVFALTMSNYTEKYGLEWQVNFNPKGCEYMDKLNEEYGFNFQHALNGGEVQFKQFYVDGYDKERNIVFEYDEYRHYKDYRKNILTDRDIERMYIIHEETGCRFLRYNEKIDKLYEFEF